MSVEDAAEKLRDCTHSQAINHGVALRCPFCGAMQVDGGPWAQPHYVAMLVAAWKKEHPDDVAR